MFCFAYCSNLDANFIEDIPTEAFKYCRNLRLLQLDANNLQHVPSEALQYLKSLQALLVFYIGISPTCVEFS